MKTTTVKLFIKLIFNVKACGIVFLLVYSILCHLKCFRNSYVLRITYSFIFRILIKITKLTKRNDWISCVDAYSLMLLVLLSKTYTVR